MCWMQIWAILCFPLLHISTDLTHWGRDKMAAVSRRHFQMHFLEWKCINFDWNFTEGVPINNIPALVQIMAWRRLGDKPLSEPMMDSLLTHICVTRPQSVNRMDLRLGVRPAEGLDSFYWKKWSLNFTLLHKIPCTASCCVIHPLLKQYIVIKILLSDFLIFNI